MEMEKAIPTGYMTVGQVARKMDVTVRTLQHYDREGLLSPTAISAGGRRLYTDKDIVLLHQILAMRHLGFSLKDIKDRLPKLETPEQVACALEEQAGEIEQKIRSLSQALQEIQALRQEVLQMGKVDFEKYADIVVNLQMGNEFYWLIKHFDQDTLGHIRNRFDQKSGLEFIQTFLTLQERAVQLGKQGVAPQSPEGQAFAREYWDMITRFTGGDWSLLPKLEQMGRLEGADPAWKERQEQANEFVGPALEVYFSALGVDPFAQTGEKA